MRKFLILVLLFFGFIGLVFANTKITELTEDTTPTTDDLTITVNDPSGTPATRKVTISNFLRDANIPSAITRDAEWDTAAEIETATGVNFLVSTELDTIAELETLLGSVNVILSTEIDTLTEINALTTDDDVVGHTRTLTAGVGLSGGGSLSADRTFTLDLTEISTATFGAGSFTTMTFDAGATDPVIDFGSSIINISTGNLGIGSASPTQKLDVTGNINLSGSIVSAGSGQSTFNQGLIVNANSGSTSSDDFQVKGTSDALAIYLQSSTNNMGIGTSTPSQKLQVVGNGTFSGFLAEATDSSW